MRSQPTFAFDVARLSVSPSQSHFCRVYERTSSLSVSRFLFWRLSSWFLGLKRFDDGTIVLFDDFTRVFYSFMLFRTWDLLSEANSGALAVVNFPVQFWPLPGRLASFSSFSLLLCRVRYFLSKNFDSACLRYSVFLKPR